MMRRRKTLKEGRRIRNFGNEGSWGKRSKEHCTRERKRVKIE